MSIFNCLNPIYSMSPSDQQTCPHTLGLIIAGFIFLFILIVGYSLHMQEVKKFEKQEIDEHGNRPDKPNLGNTMIVAFICGLLLAAMAYFITKFMFNITVSQNDAMVRNYMDNMGMTRDQALRMVAETRRNRDLVAAVRDGRR